ncbi:MAG: cereblon family protein [Desulfococcaceae bacterium]
MPSIHTPSAPAGGPLKAFQVVDDKKLETLDKIEEEEKTSDEDEDGKAIRCRSCGHKVTDTRYRFEMHGRHCHVFNNPAGFVFEIGCFSAAEGCANAGQPTLEFTWFTGYTWRYALCAGCHAHLGWQYQATSGGGFYGLILANLIEEND